MTEQGAKEALFKLHFEYMSHSPKERLDLYDEYQKKRNEIRQALVISTAKQKENERKMK